MVNVIKDSEVFWILVHCSTVY